MCIVVKLCFWINNNDNNNNNKLINTKVSVFFSLSIFFFLFRVVFFWFGSVLFVSVQLLTHCTLCVSDKKKLVSRYMANRHIECFFFNKIIFVVDFCFLFVYNNNIMMMIVKTTNLFVLLLTYTVKCTRVFYKNPTSSKFFEISSN